MSSRQFMNNASNNMIPIISKLGNRTRKQIFIIWRIRKPGLISLMFFILDNLISPNCWLHKGFELRKSYVLKFILSLVTFNDLWGYELLWKKCSYWYCHYLFVLNKVFVAENITWKETKLILFFTLASHLP